MPTTLPGSASRLRGAALLALLALGAGCGPFGYLKKGAKEANRAVAEAESSRAEEYAPYEYWGAVSYLEQAKVMMAYSEYERSFDYATRAKQLAEEAKVKAERREAGKTVERDPTIAAPDEAVEKVYDPEQDPAKAPAAASGTAGEGKAKGKAKASAGVGGGR